MAFGAKRGAFFLAIAVVVAALAYISLWAFLGRGQVSADLADALRDLSNAAPVFSGAEGFGTDTPAGRGGAEVHVTNLDPAGPGSLREAVSAEGPRTVVFDVAGTIGILDPIVISHPFVTVAGQTAPSPGITVTGAGIVIETHDVLLQHLRIRVGDRKEGPDPGGRDGISIYDGRQDNGPTARVAIDHCSVSWAIDEGVSTWGNGVEDVTFRHCIVAENLSHSLHPEGEHSKGLLIGDHARRIAVIGCLFAHNTTRNPQIKGDVSALVVNNVVYDCGYEAIHFADPEESGPSLATVMGNVVIPGADTPWYAPVVTVEETVKAGTRVRVGDNPSRLWLKTFHLNPLRWIRGFVDKQDDPPVWVTPLEIRSAGDVLEWVLANAGARPDDRDTVDTRIVRQVREGTGRIVDSPGEVGGI